MDSPCDVAVRFIECPVQDEDWCGVSFQCLQTTSRRCKEFFKISIFLTACSQLGICGLNLASWQNLEKLLSKSAQEFIFSHLRQTNVNTSARNYVFSDQLDFAASWSCAQYIGPNFQIAKEKSKTKMIINYRWNFRKYVAIEGSFQNLISDYIDNFCWGYMTRKSAIYI